MRLKSDFGVQILLACACRVIFDRKCAGNVGSYVEKLWWSSEIKKRHLSIIHKSIKGGGRELLSYIQLSGEEQFGINPPKSTGTGPPKIQTYPNVRPSQRTMPPNPHKQSSPQPKRRSRLLQLHIHPMQRSRLHRTKRTMSKSHRSSLSKRRAIPRPLHAKLPEMRRIQKTSRKTKTNPRKNNIRSLTTTKTIKAKGMY